MTESKRCMVSLSEVLEVCGNPLNEPEIWSILRQSASAIQDLCISRKHFDSFQGHDQCFPVIIPETLFMHQEGFISFEFIVSPADQTDFVAPELKPMESYNDHQIDKMLIYSLGKILRHAATFHMSCYLSPSLNETLNFMHQENAVLRHSLASLFDIILQYARIGTPFSLIIIRMFEEIMGNSVEVASLPESDEDIDSLFYENNIEEASELKHEKMSVSSTTMNAAQIKNMVVYVDAPIISIGCENTTNVQCAEHGLSNLPCAKVEQDEVGLAIPQNVSLDEVQESILDFQKLDVSANRKMPIDDLEMNFASKLNGCQEMSATKEQACIVGFEFAIRSCRAVINLHLLDSEQSSGVVKIINIVSLSGQRFAVEIHADSTTTGDIFHAVAAYENLKERFLFGLAYMRGEEFIFLDLEFNFSKMVHKMGQKHRLKPITLYLRVKFYVNISAISDPAARRLHYLQLRKDVLEERISCPLQSSILLATLALQVEFHGVGLEHSTVFHLEHYVPLWIVRRSDSDSIRTDLIRLHDSSDNRLSPEAGLVEFTRHVHGLRDHGFHFHVVQRDKRDMKSVILLGVCLSGISIFAPLDRDEGENKQELQRYTWQHITRITHDKHHFYLTLQSRNLKNHFMKCRFHTRDHLGQYLFNLSFAHHRLHLRLISQLDDSKSPTPCLGSNGEDLVQQTNSRTQTNVMKPRRSKTFRDIMILRTKRKPTLNSADGPRNQRISSNKAVRKPSLLSNLFCKGNLSLPKGYQKSTQPYVIDTSIGSRQSDFSVLKVDELISDSLDEKFANLSGLEHFERRISDVILMRDKSNCLGITVCEGADRATYVQSVACRHHGLNIRPGDRIVVVNGRYVESMSYDSVVKLLKECRLPEVKLTISQDLDRLEDDVFEQLTVPVVANKLELTNGCRSSSDVTYECHDGDLRNEITSMWFIKEQPVHVTSTRLPCSDTPGSSKSVTSNLMSEETVSPASEAISGTNVEQNYLCNETNSWSTTSSSSSSSLERCCCAKIGPSSSALDGATSAAGLCQQEHQQRQQQSDDFDAETEECSKVNVADDSKATTEGHPLSTDSSKQKKDPSSNESVRATTMVMKPNLKSDVNAVDFKPSTNGGADNVAGSPVRTVLWNPRHSGTVRSKVCNFEEQSQRSIRSTPPSSPSRRNANCRSPTCFQQKVPKSMSLYKFPSADYEDDIDDDGDISDIGEARGRGSWCYAAVRGRPYPHKHVPQLARSKTMPTVYREHVESGPNSPTFPVSSSPPPWAAAARPLKQSSIRCWPPKRPTSSIEADRTKEAPKSPPKLGFPAKDSIVAQPPPPPPRRSIGHRDSFHEYRPLVYEGLPRLSLSASLDDVTRSPSLVAIAKEKLRKQSTLPEVPRRILARSSTTENIRHGFNERIGVAMDSPRRPLSMFADDRIGRLQSWLPFINDATTFKVSIQKNSRGLGLSVCGGKDQDPDDPLSQLIRIKRLYPLHPASETGQLKIGDVLLVVNGRHLTGLNQSEVLDALRVASGTIELVVCRPPPGVLPPVPQTSGLISCSLSLSTMNLLGLAGDTDFDNPSSNPKEFEVIMEKCSGSLGFTLHKCDKPHSGQYVKALVKDPALTDGRIRPGDEILNVNGTKITGMSQTEAISFLRSAASVVVLLVSRGADLPISPLLPHTSGMFLADDEDCRSRRDKKVLSVKVVSSTSGGFSKRVFNALNVELDLIEVRLFESRREALDLLSDKEKRRSQESGCSTASVSPISRRHLRKDRSPSNSDAAETNSSASDLDYRREAAFLSSAVQKSDSLLKVPRPSHLHLSGSSSSGSSTPSPVPVPSLLYSAWQLNGRNPSHPMPFGDGHEPYSPNTESGFPKQVESALTPSTLDVNWEPLESCVLEQVWPTNLTVELDRNLSSRLGFTLLGIEDGHLKGTYIKSIHPEGLAAQDGRLKPGDNLIKVNGMLIKDLATNCVIEMLRKISGRISLDVTRDPVVSSKVLATSRVIRSPSLLRKQNNG